MAADGTDLVSLLPASNVVGTTRVRHPTIYVFTGGNEDAAFLSIYGFNLLLDGGDQKEIAYWNFIKNYDKINLVLSTRPSPNCLRGISTILARKAIEQCHPKIGAFIGNLPARANCTSDNDSAKSILSVYEGLQAEGIKPYDAYVNPKMEPLTLYEVIGEGSLKMFVLNPERGSKDLVGLANAVKCGGDGVEEYSVATSIAVVLIWQPFDHSKPTIRILYPGACPLEKLYASLEKLKGEECLRHVEFVSADLEKYSSNLSLNVRGTSRRTLSATKVSPSLRSSGKPSPGLSPRVPVPPKLSPQGNKSVSRAVTNSEPRLRPAENVSNHRTVGVTKKPATLPHGRTTSNATPSTKTALASSRTPVLGKKDVKEVNSKTTTRTLITKPPAVPHKSFTSGVTRDKKLHKTTKDSKAVDQVVVDNDTTGTTTEKPSLHKAMAAKTVEATSLQMDETLAHESVVAVSSQSNVSAPISDTDTKMPEDIAEAKSVKVRPLPDPEDFVAGPQLPSDNGMLDGIEEPSKLQLIEPEVNTDGSSETELKSPADNSLSPFITKEVKKFLGTSCGDVPPASLGLSNLIMAENSMENKPLIEVPVPEKRAEGSVVTGDRLTNDIAFNGNESEEPGNKTMASMAGLICSTDRSVEEDIDPLENKTLVDESKDYDLKQKHILTENDLKVCETAKQNGNSSEAMQAQNLLEDANASDHCLPPVTPKVAKPQIKRTVGLVTKPKLSQPLYFDVVFVPHHGSSPALLDEVAAKAFALSVRSKRYILSGQDAGKTFILDGFIAAKNVWNKPELEIDVLPTHSTDGLFAFNNLKQAEMIEAGMNLRCAVDRCTVRLSSSNNSDCNDCCSAFKFEL